ncbi:alanine dehydrogenase [Microbacterium dextranolyticum]|uniref:Alanine dehydrogenase n=1 Tax=Microbacterium dextranolyticum TaxID=36806 RepID=A0A9W6HKZ5_9MICO|nr:alanine dehydrogenase [Microbacterium dextranolyticum]MBM7464201.1 alanine dehydrogenase [Microbacterium dextranolyticum]GLJ95195.1 alanine dehydrogenase [Microbacterium dextranolyticum]
MIIGVPAEIKDSERRVGMTPTGVDELVARGHRVLVQRGAGEGSGFSDEAYVAAGADLGADAADVWSAADLLVKVKEPIAPEYAFLRRDLTLFTYLHLAADRELTRALQDAGTTAIAYETVQLPDRSLPLLAPMSEIAGRLSVQVGAQQLLGPAGGRGILLGGVPGTPRGRVVVIGGGVAGTHAAQMAVGLGAHVTIVDVSIPRLRVLDEQFGGRVDTRVSSRSVISDLVADADLVIGSVLIPGAAAPKLVTLDMVARMRAGSVLVDIAVDQGGCFEGTHATTHTDPTYRVHDAMYYAVANMPGAVPLTSTLALTNATLRYTIALAEHGVDAALAADPSLAAGLSIRGGEIVDTRILG